MDVQAERLRRTLIIRADASKMVGGGHVMRCIALAKAWCSKQDKINSRVLFICADITVGLRQLIVSHGFDFNPITAEIGSLEDANLTLLLSTEYCATAVVLDGYHFSPQYQRVLYGRVSKLVIYDDEANSEEFHCNILVNQNISARAEDYRVKAKDALLLVGTKYAAIRHEFTQQASIKRRYHGSSNIVLSLGLSDQTDAVLKILRSLELISEQQLHVCVLAGGCDMPRLQSCSREIQHSFKFLEFADDIARRLADADFAILASGGTANEAAILGTPMILVCVAENQEPAYQQYIKSGGALAGGFAARLSAANFAGIIGLMRSSEELRRRLGECAVNGIDDHGAGRVVNAILDH